jgi:chromosome segregation ATPase
VVLARRDLSTVSPACILIPKEVHAVMQQTIQSQPFFTNDLVGLIKVLATIVIPTAGAILASVWKFMRGDLQMADARLQEAVQRGDAEIRRDIDGLGARVSAVESRQTELDGSIRTMSEVIQGQARELALVASTHDTIDRRLSELREGMEGLRSSLTTSIHAAGREATQEIAQVRERLAMIEKVAMLVERGVVRHNVRERSR